MIAKYLATSLAMEKVVRAPRVISSCLPTSTISISLVGSLSRSTMLPASRAAWVPVCMATPTSAWASAGASLEPSPHMATRRPLACSSRIRRSLSSGRGLGEEVVDAGFGGDGGGGDRVVAGDHHGAQAHPAQVGEAFLHPRLDHVLEVDDAHQLEVLGDGQGRTARARDAVHGGGDFRGDLVGAEADQAVDRVDRTLAPAVLRRRRRRTGGWWR